MSADTTKMPKKKKPPPEKDPEGCYFFPGCLEKSHNIVPKFKFPKQPEFSKPSQLCLYHLDWQPSQFYYICTYCATFYREDEVKFTKMPVDGKELKKMKDKKNKKKGGGKKGKKGAKSAAPAKKGKGKKGGQDDEPAKEKPKEDPIKNEISIAVCKNCLPIGCEMIAPVLAPPTEEPPGLL